MELTEKILLGLFVGFLCGLIPFIYGILNKRRLSSLIALLVTTLIGVILSLLGITPFSAVVVAIRFVFIDIAKKRKGSDNHSDNDE